jgi:hypothetical protein
VAAKGATLAIRIISDASKSGQGFAEAESKVAGFSRGLDKASIAAGGLLGGLAAAGKEAFDAASALQQSTGAIDSVFGDWALDIEQAAERGAQAVGLAQSAYQDAAALIGSQLKSLGFPIDENVKKTQELIGVGSDLAATFGGTTEDAVAALSSALKGERDPIERYGISLSQAAVDAKTAAMGLDTSSDSAKRNADAQATLAIITEQAGSALGAFAREGDTAAGASQRAAAEFENAKAKLGDVLLPIVADGMTAFSDFTGTLTEHKDTVQLLAGVLGGLAVATLAINGAMRVYAAGQALASAAVWVFNAALWANPIVWVVAAIAALVVAVVLAYKKFEWFRSIIQSVWEWLKKAWDFAGGLLSKVGDFFSAPQTMTVTPVVGGLAGSYGSAGVPGIYGAPMTALAGGGPSSAGQGPDSPTTVVNVTVQGAVDSVATGRQLVKILREYGVATGGQVSLTIGGRS